MAKEKHRIYTNKQINEMTQQARYRAFSYAVVMSIAYMMEDPEFDFDEDRIVDTYMNILNWEKHRSGSHDISIKQVMKIIEDHTGIKMEMMI